MKKLFKMLVSTTYSKIVEISLDFGFATTDVNLKQHRQCVLGIQILTPEKMLSNTLKHQLETEVITVINSVRLIISVTMVSLII